MRVLSEVIDKKDDYYIIKYYKKQACGSCKMCANHDNESTAIAYAEKEYNIGDIVYATLPPEKIMYASFILYMLPIVFFFIGYLIGYLIKYRYFIENLEIYFSVFMFFFSFFVINRLSKKYEKKYRIMIEK